jgi:hypothetical protein
MRNVTIEVFPSPSFDGTVELGLHILQDSAVGAKVIVSNAQLGSES